MAESGDASPPPDKVENAAASALPSPTEDPKESTAVPETAANPERSTADGLPPPSQAAEASESRPRVAFEDAGDGDSDGISEDADLGVGSRFSLLNALPSAGETVPAAPTAPTDVQESTPDADALQPVEKLLDSEYRKLRFQHDVFTTTFLSYLIWPGKGIYNQCAQMLTVILVMFMQGFILSEVVSGPVDVWFDKVNLWNMAASELILTNTTMSKDVSSKICGTFEQREYGFGSKGSVIKMKDGTLYSPENGTDLTVLPVFRSVKLPSNTWQIESMGARYSHLDESIYILGGAEWSTNSFGYTTYRDVFIVILVSFFLVFMAKCGNLISFTCLLLYKQEGDDKHMIACDLNLENFRIIRLNLPAFLFGLFLSNLRLLLTGAFFFGGLVVLIFSLSKWELIMNFIVLVFVINLDQIVYKAFVRDTFQVMIAASKPVESTVMEYRRSWKALCTIGAISAAVYGRHIQLLYFRSQLNMVAPLCLLGGPSPAYTTDRVLAPAAGLCESLLSLTCAPNVTGKGRVKGHCIVAQGPRLPMELDPDYPFQWRVFTAYIHDGLYPSLALLGSDRVPKPRDELSDWAANPYITNMRQYCISTYQERFNVDRRVVDRGTKEIMNGSPFFCKRAVWQEELLNAYSLWAERVNDRKDGWLDQRLDARKIVFGDLRMMMFSKQKDEKVALLHRVSNIYEKCRYGVGGNQSSNQSAADNGNASLVEKRGGGPKKPLMRRHGHRRKYALEQDIDNHGLIWAHLDQHFRNA